MSISFNIPCYINKFIESVEMPKEAFSNNWANITNNTPDTF